MSEELVKESDQKLIYCADRGVDTRPLALSFRDQCAIAAMRCVCIPALHFNGGMPTFRDEDLSHYINQIFDLADAMQLERQKREKK